MAEITRDKKKPVPKTEQAFIIHLSSRSIFLVNSNSFSQVIDQARHGFFGEDKRNLLSPAFATVSREASEINFVSVHVSFVIAD